MRKNAINLKIHYIAMLSDILNIKGLKNCRICKKVMVALLDGAYRLVPQDKNVFPGKSAYCA